MFFHSLKMLLCKLKKKHLKQTSTLQTTKLCTFQYRRQKKLWKEILCTRCLRKIVCFLSFNCNPFPACRRTTHPCRTSTCTVNPIGLPFSLQPVAVKC